MISVSGLTKKFTSNGREATAVADASITVEDNEIVVLLGPSGSGKTTLLRCVAGLESASEGEIAIGNQVVFSSRHHTNVPSEMRRIGMVFQSYAIWPHLTVAENVALPLLHGTMRVSKAAVKEKVSKALRAVKLSAFEDRPAPFLSGGQQQRVALARALAVEPRALLMDEPLSNLDARLREEVRFEIHDIAKKAGLPVLYVTHDQTEALALADRVAIMDQGRILQVDKPEAVYERPANATVAGFLGSMNWLSGKSGPNGQIETPLGALTMPRAPIGPSVQVGIRPELIELSLAPLSGANVFQGKMHGGLFPWRPPALPHRNRQRVAYGEALSQPAAGLPQQGILRVVPRALHAGLPGGVRNAERAIHWRSSQAGVSTGYDGSHRRGPGMTEQISGVQSR
jgi:iron(III) transport system ATP-binding protein